MDIPRLLTAYMAAVVSDAPHVTFDGQQLPYEHVEEILETEIRAPATPARSAEHHTES